MDTKTKLKTNLLIAALGIGVMPAFAQAALQEGDMVGTDEAAIRATLEGAGYEVIEIEIEDNEIEAEVTQGGKEYEIGISVKTGAVTEIEAEDDDDDD